MRIALLKCDNVKPDLIDVDGDYEVMFYNSLRYVAHNLQIDTYQVIQGEYPRDHKLYDGMIISGSSFSVYDEEPWIEKLIEYVQTLHFYKVKLIGICFGHQLIAQALGGKVECSDKGWGLGAMLVKVTQELDWMYPPMDKFSIPLSHQDQVVELPGSAQCLGENHFCPYSMYQFDNHILCFQGHPEYSPEYCRALYLSRSDVIDKEVLSEGIESLDHKLDNKVILNWIVNFLEF